MTLFPQDRDPHSNLKQQLDMGLPALTEKQKVEALEALGLDEDFDPTQMGEKEEDRYDRPNNSVEPLIFDPEGEGAEPLIWDDLGTEKEDTIDREDWAKAQEESMKQQYTNSSNGTIHDPIQLGAAGADLSPSDDDDDTERLNITVEVPESASSDQREMYHQLAQIYQESLQLVIDKNQDYGNAFLRTNDHSAFESDIAEVLYGLHVRADDKDDRFTEQVFGERNLPHIDEDVDETTIDNIGYWSWLTWVLRHYDSEDDEQ